MSLRRLLIAAAVAALVASPAMARDPVVLAKGAQEIAISLDALRTLPAQTREVTFQTSKGTETGRYTGTLLWNLLTEHKLIDADAHHGLTRNVVIVTASDGYMLVLSAGELAPELGDAPVMLAYSRDGAEIEPARSPRLIVPGDRRGARNVFDVARIEVRALETPRQEKTP